MKKYFKKRSFNQMISGLLALVLIATCVWVQPATEVEAEEPVEVVRAIGQSYVEKRDLTEYIGAKAPKPTKEEYANWLFAGWYQDADCTQIIVDSSEIQKGKNYYAKYVPEEVLTVKFQLSTGDASSAESVKMRLLSTIDSLLYGAVGFKVEIDKIGFTESRAQKTVYSKINSKTEGLDFAYEPSVFQFEASDYFITSTINGIPKLHFDSDIRITPWWKTADGTMVYGLTRTVRVSDTYTERVNVPIRMYSDTTLTENDSVTVNYNSTMYDYEGIDKGTLINEEAITVDANTAGQVVCTVNDTVATEITADGMLANLRFKKKEGVNAVTTDAFQISSENTDTKNLSNQVFYCHQTAITDGCFSASELYHYGVPTYDYHLTSTEDEDDWTGEIVETLVAPTDTDVAYVAYDFSDTPDLKGLKAISVENALLKTADFSKMTVKMRTASGDHPANVSWRFYINPNLDNKTELSARPGTNIVRTDGGASYVINPDVVAVSEEPNEKGWYTITFDLGNLSQWISQESVAGFSFGYVAEKQEVQHIAGIKFWKTEEIFGSDVIAGPKLMELGTAGYNIVEDVTADNNLTSNQSIQKTTGGTSVVYNFSTTGEGRKVIAISKNMGMPSDYTSMTVRIRSNSYDTTDTTDTTVRTIFTNVGLWINPKITETQISLGTKVCQVTPLTGEAYTDAKEATDSTAAVEATLTVSAPDEDGWVDVTFHLANLSGWRDAEAITGFAFGYVNTGKEQEIAEIRFEKRTAGISKDVLYAMATAYEDSNSSRPAVKTLQDTGVKYDFLDYAHNTQKNIFIENLELNPSEYTNVSFKIRSLSKNESTAEMEGTAAGELYGFTSWNFYINPDSTLTKEQGAAGTSVLDGEALNSGAYTVTGPDTDGWITVTINLSEITQWTGASVILGINIGYVNHGRSQEISKIIFTK